MCSWGLGESSVGWWRAGQFVLTVWGGLAPAEDIQEAIDVLTSCLAYIGHPAGGGR